MTSFNHSLIATKFGVLVLPRMDTLDYANLAEPDVHAESATQQYPIGTALITDDGVYRYAQCGAVAVTIGKLLQAPAVNTNADVDVAVAVDAAIGDTTVTITAPTGDLTLNQYKDGFLYVNDATGNGASYKIKSHPAATATASCVITLVDAIEVALVAGTSEVGLVKNPYHGVVVNPTTASGIPVGVVNHSSFTATYYAWIKTKGVVPVLTNGTVVLGEPVVAGNTTAGSVDAYNEDGASNNVIVGQVMAVGATTDYSLVKIDLDLSW